MRAVVFGGNGVLGRLVVAELRSRGHDAVVASRTSGADARTGAGVRKAIRGADVVLDCSNVQTASGRTAVAGFGAIAHHLAHAVLTEHVPHLVAITIFGVHGAEMQRRNGYYRGKAEQERVLAVSGAPVTLVRSTQWFELAEAFLKGRIGPVAVVPHMRSQPVAATEAARAMVHAAEAGPGGADRGVAGPEERDVADLATALAARRGDPSRVLAFRVPGAGRLFDRGELIPGPDVPRTGPTFAEWLDLRVPPAG